MRRRWIQTPSWRALRMPSRDVSLADPHPVTRDQGRGPVPEGGLWDCYREPIGRLTFSRGQYRPVRVRALRDAPDAPHEGPCKLSQAEAAGGGVPAYCRCRRMGDRPEPLARDGDGAPYGPLNCVIVNPDDLLELPSHPDSRRSRGCCRRDGQDGPNLTCPACRAEVATVLDDCWTYREVRLEPLCIVAVPLG